MTSMDWAKGYLLITLTAFLCEYVRVRVDYHILELVLIVAAVPVVLFGISLVFYLILASLTDHVCDFIENRHSAGRMRTDP